MKEIIITSLEEGQRLDRVLQRYLPGASAGFLYKMLRKKNITLNGGKASGSEKLAAADVIRVYFSEETLQRFMQKGSEERFPAAHLDIVYEDAHILLINKKAGMLSQKADPGDVSLNEYAIGYLLETGAVDRDSLSLVRPSVCNRLDRNTSGIVAVGKSAAGLRELSAMFRDRTAHKYYLTLVTGILDREALIDGCLSKDEKHNTVKVTAAPSRDEPESGTAGRPGEKAPHKKAQLKKAQAGKEPQRIKTRYIPLAHRNDGNPDHDLTLLEVELITGKSHQIRAHLASVGHPVVGDPKYGNSRRNEYFRREYGLKGQLLHAARLVFPKMEGELSGLSGREFTAPLPALFDKIIKGENLN